MKKITITAILLISISLIVTYYLNSNYFELWNNNNVQIITKKPLLAEKVKIEFGVSVNTINRENDLDLFKNRNKYTIIFEGEKKNSIANSYGENDYLITYDNKYYLSFRHFKFSPNHQHNYEFKFIPQNNSIILSVFIDGESGMKFEREMLKIDDAEKYVCNTPIDNAGGIYNMVELENDK
ncbi:hypothetical protein [Aureispira sp. CCB-E]|uniref:hypothetical protein n=1 Tax=Aureispira sp. CCB-E TaxID=3051121 RepID=UPI00286879F6|nr:hypothetical protein [Aureispira sp. CCB-E]WMX13169.1 hypothetical protein QP953_20205 [Aureispira sp. CCB-E]